jgi:hypothetical protein
VLLASKGYRELSLKPFICLNKAQSDKTACILADNAIHGIFQSFPSLFSLVVLDYAPTLCWSIYFLSKDEDLITFLIVNNIHFPYGTMPGILCEKNLEPFCWQKPIVLETTKVREKIILVLLAF